MRILLALLLVADAAFAAPELASDSGAPARKVLPAPKPAGRIIYSNDDVWDWAAAGIVPAQSDIVFGEQRHDSPHFVPESGGNVRSAVVINCCDNGSVAVPEELADQLMKTLARGGDVVMLDDGNALAPLFAELVKRRYQQSCATMTAMPVQWVDGRTRMLIPNREVDRVAQCLSTKAVEIHRDATQTAGRVLVLDKAAPKLAK